MKDGRLHQPSSRRRSGKGGMERGKVGRKKEAVSGLASRWSGSSFYRPVYDRRALSRHIIGRVSAFAGILIHQCQRGGVQQQSGDTSVCVAIAGSLGVPVSAWGVAVVGSLGFTSVCLGRGDGGQSGGTSVCIRTSESCRLCLGGL